MHTDIATFSRFPGLESGRHVAVGGVDSFSPPMHTDIATFSRFPGCDIGRHDALPPSLSPSLTPTLPMPIADRPISFSPGGAGQ
eukprot:2762739-Pyramimonas_sp.AAC.1